MFKKLLVVVCAALFLTVGAVSVVAVQNWDMEGYFRHSVTGAVKHFDKHPGEPSQWVPCTIGTCSEPEPTPGDNTVYGQWSGVAPSSDYSLTEVGNEFGEGNFAIDTFAAGGAIDIDGKLIPNGAAGGISGAGGIGIGDASGQFKSFKFFGRTITLGGAEADLSNTAGGFTNTDAGRYDPGIGKNIGVYSTSNNYAITQGNLHVAAWGFAESHGVIAGAAGQGSLDGSIVGPSPLHQWETKGVTLGIAGQGSIGAYAGGAGAAGLGSADVGAGIEMWGGSTSKSYRGIDENTEYMGSNVSAYTTVSSDSNVEQHLIGAGFVEGGWVAGGVAASLTAQANPYGVAKASAIGTYSAAGELGCNFNGSANGYTYTSSTQIPGMKGSVMTSQAGMQVKSSPLLQN